MIRQRKVEDAIASIDTDRNSDVCRHFSFRESCNTSERDDREIDTHDDSCD